MHHQTKETKSSFWIQNEILEKIYYVKYFKAKLSTKTAISKPSSILILNLPPKLAQ